MYPLQDDRSLQPDPPPFVREAELERILPLPLSPCVAWRVVEVDFRAGLIASGPDPHRSLHDEAASRGTTLTRAGRACAASLLEGLGSPELSVTRMSDGAPRWPLGYTGSISHTGALVAVAVCPRSFRRSLGIDLEAVPSLQAAREAATVCLAPAERRLCEAASIDPCFGLTIAFSAKEALFKCLGPVSDVQPGFRDLEVTSIDAERGCLQLALRRALSRELPGGRAYDISVRFNRTHVFTSVELLP